MKVLGVFATGCLLLPAALAGGRAGGIFPARAFSGLPAKVVLSPGDPGRKPESTMEVADALDRYVQPRFQIIGDRDFGTSRVVQRGHTGIVGLKIETSREQALIADVDAANRDYTISLLRCVSSPAYRILPGQAQLHLLYYNQQQVASSDVDNNGGTRKQWELRSKFDSAAIEQRARAVLDRLLAGQEYRAEGSRWDLLMRPVRASKTACLGCHKGSKLGDTLGVMVYAVGREQRSARIAATGR
jgi:hypothetical protein